MMRVQQLLIGRVAIRLTGADLIPADPRPAAIVGAAFACMQAARTAWLASNQSTPFSSYLDEAMDTIQTRITEP